MKIHRLVAAAAVLLFGAAPAAAHVTIQPNEAVQGTFSRFVVRVPTERDVPTTEVEVRFPPLAFVSFQPKEGWEREEETGEFAEPVEAFGEEIAEGVLSVTWSGGTIAPGEFEEFVFSAKMPDGEEDLAFEGIQTYEDGEVVEWTGAADSDTPAPGVSVYDIGASEEGGGPLSVLAQMNGSADEEEGDEDEGAKGPALYVAIGAAVLALLALIMSTRRLGT